MTNRSKGSEKATSTATPAAKRKLEAQRRASRQDGFEAEVKPDAVSEAARGYDQAVDSKEVGMAHEAARQEFELAAEADMANPPLDFEHEYERPEPPGIEAGTPERRVNAPPVDGPPREEPLSVAPDEVGAHFLERATGTIAEHSGGEEPLPIDEESRLRQGEKDMLDQQPGQSVSHGPVVTAQPNRTDEEAEQSERARRAAQESRRGERGGDDARHRAVEWRRREPGVEGRNESDSQS